MGSNLLAVVAVHDSRSAYRVPTQFQLIVDRVGVTRADADGFRFSAVGLSHCHPLPDRDGHSARGSLLLGSRQRVPESS